MRGSFCVLFLAAAFHVAFLQDVDIECPNPIPVECEDIKMCDNITCPRAANAKCCVELSEGKCTARIHRLTTLRNITETCIEGRGSCLEQECPEHTACLEEVEECPLDQPNCDIRLVKPSCVSLEIRRLPSTCSDVTCKANSTCVVAETALGTRAVCKKTVPESCADMKCSRGMKCVERETPKCIPRWEVSRPWNCSQLECPKGLICMVLDRDTGAICAKRAPATNCDQLNCTGNLVCEEDEDKKEAKCVQTVWDTPLGRIDRSCEDLNCEEGNKCMLIINRTANGDTRPVATCVPSKCPQKKRLRPPTSCEEVQCKSEEICVLCGEGNETRAWCTLNDHREGLVESTLWEAEEPVLRNDDTVRHPPKSCAELWCLSTEKCMVWNTDNNTRPIALCISDETPKSCDEIQCDQETETCEEWVKKNVKVARCVPLKLEDATEQPSAAPLKKWKPRRDTAPVLIQTVISPRDKDVNNRSWPLAKSCDELECGLRSQWQCMQLWKNGKKNRAMCIKLREDATCRVPLAPVLDGPTVGTDINLIKKNKRSTEKKAADSVLSEWKKPDAEVNQSSWNLPDRCMERRCCEGETCMVKRDENSRKPLAVCVPEKKKARLQPLTCEDLMCKEGLKCKMRAWQRGEDRLWRGRKAICMQLQSDVRTPTAAPTELPVPKKPANQPSLPRRKSKN